jgi:hypothetical protein
MANINKRILSIDGGGIRGIIPLTALMALEKQTGKPAYEHFDMVAGTSTGSIIAGGLARGLTASRILELYQEAGPAVFRRDWILWVTSLFSYKYRNAPLYELLKKYLGDTTLNESPIDLMLTATRVSDGFNWYFVKDNAANAQTTGNLKLTDCITASAAAPTYFEPWDVPTIGACVDGGVGIAGNPVYQTCVEAFYYTPVGTYSPESTVIVSLGTGFFPTHAKPANIIEWVQYIVGELLDAPSQQQTDIVLRHFATSPTYRWNPKLPREIDMDNVNEIPALIEIGNQAAAELNWPDILAGSTQSNRMSTSSRVMRRNMP